MYKKVNNQPHSLGFERLEDAPIHQVDHPLLREHQIELYIKRDDLIHPFISGNKWRKLKYILQDMKHLGKNHLVTFGGPWSNHILAAACAGASFGFKTTAFVRGEKVHNAVLAMAKIFGMELIFTERSKYKQTEVLFEEYKNNTKYSESCYYLDQGGHHPLALKGCSEIIQELPFAPDAIYCACGTGTTIAGISLAKPPNTKLIGIPVIGQGENLRTAIQSLQPQAEFDLLSQYHFGGYAKTKPELIEFITEFCRSTGILIEPVYTGKMFYAIFDQIKRGEIPKNQKILAIHTGGLTGLLGLYDHWQ